MKKITKKKVKSVKKVVKKTTAKKKPQSMEELLSSSGHKIKGLKRGEFVVGKITEIRAKTMYVDVGGKTEGIITGKELGLIKDFVSRLKVGDEVNAQVRVLENDRGQTLLSLRKAAFENSWKYFEDALKDKKPIEVFGREVNHGGTVVTAPYGLFGFIPGSQIGTKYDINPDNLVGKKISVMVLEVDQEKNRLVFSERAVSEPGKMSEERAAVEKIKIGDKYEAEIARVEPFGLFIKVNFEKGVGLEGLVHISEVSWEKVRDLSKLFKAGQKIDVCLVNKENNKLQFSIKRLQDDPWATIEKKYPAETEIKGTVTQITSFGALVKLEPGIEGLIHISKIPPNVQLKEGEEVKCYIEHVDKNSRRLSLEMSLTEKSIIYK